MDVVSKIKELKEKIKLCKDDRLALDLQSQLINLMIETLQNKDNLLELIKNKLYKENKE